MAAGIAQVGLTGNKTSETSTVVSNISNTISVGQLSVVLVAADNAGTSGTSSISGVTDSQNNSYSLIASVNQTAGTSNDGITMAMYVAYVTTQLTQSVDTVTVNYSTATVAKAITWVYVSGVFLNPNFTDSNSGNGATYTSNASPTMTTGDIYVAAIGNESNTFPTIDSDTTNGLWNSQASARSNGTGADDTKIAILEAHKIVTGTGSQTFNGATGASTAWGVVAAGWSPGSTGLSRAQAQAQIKSRDLKPISDISNTNWLRLG